jgi:hypothetical protein
MKKSITLIMFIFLSIGLFAQEKIKQSETGFIFSNFDNFGLSFKKGSDKFMWRFNTLLLSTGVNKFSIDTSKVVSFGFGLSIGNELRKGLNENFEFCFGYDLSYRHDYSKTSKDRSYSDLRYTKNSTNGYGFNFVLGANCVIKNQVVITLEILPGIIYSKTSSESGIDIPGNTNSPSSKPKTQENKNFNFGFSNTSARLTVAYRFRK